MEEIFKSIYSLNQKKITVLVHGSWADNSRTPFSDLDDFVIVDDDYVEEAKSVLDKIEVTFQRIDPLQHHGHWLIRKSQLDSYDDSYMPLFIMENAVRIYGRSEISANILHGKSKIGFINNVRITSKNVEELFELYFRKELNIFKLKALVGSVALLPPLLFQIQDKFLDKKTAILRADELFDQDGLTIIKWATELRNNWKWITDNQKTQELFKNIWSLDNAKDMRSFASENSPVLEYSHLSEFLPKQTSVNSFLLQCMNYVDNESLRSLSLGDYEHGYKRVEEEAIKFGAVIIGKFGVVSHPGISDLDVFICFPDNGFKVGCESIIRTIESDFKLSYLFKHPPFFITESCLNDVKNIHTLFNLNITYQEGVANFKIPHKEFNNDFLFLLWAYLIFDLLTNMNDREISYIDKRQLLLILKMIHTSTDFINTKFNLGYPSSISKSVKLRELVLSDCTLTRVEIIQEFLNSKNDYFVRLSLIKNKFSFANEIFISNKHVIERGNNIEDWQKKKVKYGVYYQKLPPVFFTFIGRIVFERNSDSKKYLQTWRKLIVKNEEIGTTPDSFTLLFPKSILFKSLRIKTLVQIRYLIKVKMRRIKSVLGSSK